MKVFRIWKYIEVMQHIVSIECIINSLKLGWLQHLEGKDLIEIETTTNYVIANEWLVEEDIIK